MASQTFKKWFGEDLFNQAKKLGFDSNPALVRGLVKLAKATAEDTIAAPNAGTVKPPAKSVKQALADTYK